MPSRTLTARFEEIKFKIPVLEDRLLQGLTGKMNDAQVKIDREAKTKSLPSGSAGLFAMNIYQGGDSHAVWFFQTGPGDDDWSFFDPNGKTHMKEIITEYGVTFTRRRGRTREIINGETLKDREWTLRHLDLCPSRNINTGSDRENPGFCSIFGIGLAAYVYWYGKYGTDTDPYGWVPKWKRFLTVLRQGTKTHANDFGAYVMGVIESNNSDNRDGIACNVGHYIESLLE